MVLALFGNLQIVALRERNAHMSVSSKCLAGPWKTSFKTPKKHCKRGKVTTAALTPESESLYHTLGVAPGASLSAVKQAYRAAAKKLHPDVSDDPNAEQKFLKAQAAYQSIVELRGGTLKSVLEEETKKQWREQVSNLVQHGSQRRKEAAAKKESQAEWESAEERIRFEEMKKNTFMYENASADSRLQGQLQGLKARSGRKPRVKPQKSTWVEPENPAWDDDGWCHEVQ